MYKNTHTCLYYDNSQPINNESNDFDYFLVPDYLRTKLDLDLEAKQRELHAEAAKASPDFHVSIILGKATLMEGNVVFILIASLVQEGWASSVRLVYNYSISRKR